MNLEIVDWLLIFFTLILNTHNRFTAILEFVQDHPVEQVPES